MGQPSLRKRLTRTTMRTGHTLRHRAMDAGLLPGHTDYVRFVCVGYARTGSTLLMRSLNNHSRIVGFGEIVKNVDRYPHHYHELENLSLIHISPGNGGDPHPRRAARQLGTIGQGVYIA